MSAVDVDEILEHQLNANMLLMPYEVYAQLFDSVAELGDENAKLRELVQRMHGHIKESCDECDGWYCSNFDEDNECCVYDTLVRELGVEVDDG